MKWLLALIFLTLFFIASSFFIDERSVLTYRWMTIGMAAVAFVFYYIVWKNKQKGNEKMLGSYIAAVVVKFILSASVIILYAFIFGLHGTIEFIYFFMAYAAYSVAIYVGAYTNK